MRCARRGKLALLASRARRSLACPQAIQRQRQQQAKLGEADAQFEERAHMGVVRRVVGAGQAVQKLAGGRCRAT
jgi:hypothetical protein